MIWFLFWFVVLQNTLPGGTPPGRALVIFINFTGLFIFSFISIIYFTNKLLQDKKNKQVKILLYSQIFLLIFIIINLFLPVQSIYCLHP